MSEQVWVVCRVVDDANGDIFKAVWDILGVFDEEEKAVKACTKIVDSVGPLTLNEISGDERVSWPGGYYPLADTVGDKHHDKT